MTTEQALREALAELGGAVLALLTAEHGSGMLGPCMTAALTEGEANARAALALPPSETREEWRVRWSEVTGAGQSEQWRNNGWECASRSHADRIAGFRLGSPTCYRDVRIESRTVSTSQWVVFDPAKAEGPA